MRDRETDSWWSIITSTAIGGDLEGAELDELPVGEKTTWKEWVARHPNTKVLSVRGQEHESQNPFDTYLASNRTFRDLRIDDDRLPAKTPIFGIWLDGKTLAATHDSVAGGKLFKVPGDPARKILLHRDVGASMFASTQAWLLDAEETEGKSTAELVAALTSDHGSGHPAEGIDTFWYSWVSINASSQLLN